MTSNIFNRLTSFLNELEEKRIAYQLAHHRDDALMVLVAVPGQRWEVEFLADGSVEIEKFLSNGEILGDNALLELFASYADDDRSEPAEGSIRFFPDAKAA